MKKRWTMRRALLVLCIASVVFALLLQTFLFHQSLRRQIRAESISDHEISLNKMQTDLSNFIHTIRGEMLTIYSEQDLIAAMREAAEKDTDMKDYYWRSWYFARKRFTKEDQLLAMYLYDTKDHLISSYRYNSVTYPKDIYKAEYDDNSDRVYDYVRRQTPFPEAPGCSPLSMSFLISRRIARNTFLIFSISASCSPIF